VGSREWGMGKNASFNNSFFFLFPIPHSPFPIPHSPFPIPCTDHFIARYNNLPSLIVKPNSRRAS
jgi:hypothetical protein